MEQWATRTNEMQAEAHSIAEPDIQYTKETYVSCCCGFNTELSSLTTHEHKSICPAYSWNSGAQVGQHDARHCQGRYLGSESKALHGLHQRPVTGSEVAATINSTPAC